MDACPYRPCQERNIVQRREFLNMEQLKRYYDQINKLNEENPADLSKMIVLYSKSLQRIGNFHADRIKAHGMVYADRKSTWSKTMHDTEGTGIVKEGAAEIAIYMIRQKEAEAESEVWKWRNQFESTQEIINSLKI